MRYGLSAFIRMLTNLSKFLKSFKLFHVVIYKPDQWSYLNIVPVPKAGNLFNIDNYRGISRSCIVAKMYNRMILNRLRGAIDPFLRDNQNRFRANRTTAAQILTLRRIIEEVKLNNLSAVLTFIKLLTPSIVGR